MIDPHAFARRMSAMMQKAAVAGAIIGPAFSPVRLFVVATTVFMAVAGGRRAAAADRHRHRDFTGVFEHQGRAIGCRPFQRP